MKTNRFKTFIIFCLTIILLLPAGAGAADRQAWIVSDLIGSIDADTVVAPEDDFHAYVNREWITLAKIPQDSVNLNTFSEREMQVQEQIMALMTDDSQRSHEAQLVQMLYAQYIDMEARNALGTQPLQAAIDEIMGLETLDDVSNYILANASNMTQTLGYVMVGADYQDSTKQCVWISSPAFSLENADEYREMTDWGALMKDANDTMHIKLLMHAGLSAEEAAKINDAAFALETQIAQASMGVEATLEEDYLGSIYNPVTLAELEALSPEYPITGILKPYIDAGVDSFILTEPDWLARMNEIYTRENIEGIKSYLICNIASYMSDVLDQTCMDIQDEWISTVYGVEVVTNIETAACEYCSVVLDMLVGRMYSDAYVSPETKADVQDMIKGVVAVYRERLENNNWLTQDTKQKAIKKLDNLKVRVAYPDDWSIYETQGLVLKSSVEGGNLADNVRRINDYFQEYFVSLAAAPVNSNRWNITPQTVNAMYDCADNSINIPAGILGGIYYNPQAPEEANLGGIGMIIAHEITHAFDDWGSQFDENGNFLNWWTDTDAEAFYARLAGVSEYFGQFEVLPDVFVNGDLVVGEAVADLGAMSCMLEIAAGIEDFDYKLFFESYAAMWPIQETAEGLAERVRVNAHPPQYLRTNVIVQQFQEFYDTYGIEEGDGMYLAPEERLSVW